MSSTHPPAPRQPADGRVGTDGGFAVRDPWDDETAERSYKSLSREEAQALRARSPSVSPWRVVSVQAMTGAAVALVAGLLWQDRVVFWSALYGAATVVVPAMLMARGMTSRLSSMSPSASAVSFMLWEFVKIGVSVGMLMLAPRIVSPLNWPALLVGLLVCIKVYWVALSWRGRVRNER